MRVITAVICVEFMSIVAFAAHHDMTASDQVKKVLSEHPEVYDFELAQYSEEDDVEERLKNFHDRRYEIIQRELLSSLDRRIKTLIRKNTISIFGRRIERRTVASSSKCILDIIGDTVACILCPPTLFTGYGNIAKTAIGGAQIIVDAYCDPPSYRSQVSELKDRKKDIEDALKDIDPKGKEEEVVRRWYEFPKNMRVTLRDSLLVLYSPHKGVKDLIAAKNKIEHCLNVPTEPKPLIPEIEHEDIDHFKERRSSFIDDKFSQSPWINYSPNTRKELKSAVTEMCNGSFKAKLGYKVSRKILFFHGKPSTGKSRAAKEIADMFDLPKIEVGSSSSDEFSQKTLTGNSTWEPERRLGLLFQPLFAKDKDGKNWKNPVVIIEEFDRMLKKGVPSFILWLFDPETKEVKCDYLGNDVFVDVANITFILTSNTDLGQDAARISSETVAETVKKIDEFEALRDRLLFVHFDPFQEQTLDSMLRDHISTHGILLFSQYHKNTNEDLSKIVSFAIQQNPNATFRQLCLKVEKLANTPEDAWIGMNAEEAAPAPPPSQSEAVDPKPQVPVRENSNLTPARSFSEVENISDIIKAAPMISAGKTGTGINVVMVDAGIDYSKLPTDRHLVPTIKFPPAENTAHGTRMAVILAGNESSVGISPGVKIASYWGVLPYEGIEDANKTWGVQIANLSLKGLTPAALHFGPRYSGEKVDKTIDKIAIVAIAGNDNQKETTMAEGLPENYYPENGNIIVTVAVDPEGKLMPRSSKCGKTKRFCVAVPSKKLTSETAPIVTGALALLMEAVPNLPVRDYVSAILESAHNHAQPNDETGVGMLDLAGAHEYLLAHSSKTASTPKSSPVQAAHTVKSQGLPPKKNYFDNAVTWTPIVTNPDGTVRTMRYQDAFNYCLNLNPAYKRDRIKAALEAIDLNDTFRDAVTEFNGVYNAQEAKEAQEAMIEKHNELLASQLKDLAGAYVLPTASMFFQYGKSLPKTSDEIGHWTSSLEVYSGSNEDYRLVFSPHHYAVEGLSPNSDPDPDPTWEFPVRCAHLAAKQY